MLLNADDILLKGQYRTLRLLGRGGFGFIYQVQDTLPRGSSYQGPILTEGRSKSSNVRKGGESS